MQSVVRWTWFWVAASLLAIACADPEPYDRAGRITETPQAGASGSLTGDGSAPVIPGTDSGSESEDGGTDDSGFTPQDSGSGGNDSGARDARSG